MYSNFYMNYIKNLHENVNNFISNIDKCFTPYKQIVNQIEL